jgi:hypothetical protein
MPFPLCDAGQESEQPGHSIAQKPDRPIDRAPGSVSRKLRPRRDTPAHLHV